MSIRTWLDNRINDALVGVSVKAHRFLTTLAPASPVRPAWMEDGADELAEFEAYVDCYEPDDVWAAEELSENPIYRELQLQHAREQGAPEDLLSKLADAQNRVHDIITPTIVRPFEDTDDFAVGEHPDIDPAAVIGKRHHWDGIGGHPVHPAGVGESEAPDASRVTNEQLVNVLQQHSWCPTTSSCWCGEPVLWGDHPRHVAQHIETIETTSA